MGVLQHSTHSQSTMSSSSATPTEHSPLISASRSSETLRGTQDELGSLADASISTARGFFLVASMGVLIFILTCNISLLTTIQGSIATDLDSFLYVSWFASTFLIAGTSVMPVAGRLWQIFSRYYLLASTVVLIIGILIAGFANSLRVFLLGRIISGVGGAAISPVTFILVTELTSEKRRGLFIGLVNVAYTTGVSLGAIIAGALEPVLGWRACFWLQVPLVVIASVTAFYAIPQNMKGKVKQTDDVGFTRKLAQIDYLGVVALTSAVVLLLYALSMPKITYIPIILSAGMLTLFVFVEAKWAVQPIVPIYVLKSRGNILTGFATIGLMSARWGILFYTPVYAIAVRGWSQAVGGMVLLPTNVGFALGGLTVGWIHIRRADSFYFSCIVTFIVFALTLFTVARLSTSTSPAWLYLASLFANGFTTGAALNYTLAHLLHLTIPETHFIVIPLNAMFRGLSGSLGSALGGGIFARTLRRTLESDFANRGLQGKEQLIRRLLGSPMLVRSLQGVDKEIAIDGYTNALHALFIVGSGVVLIMAGVQAGTGWTAPAETTTEAEDEDDLEPVTSVEPLAG